MLINFFRGWPFGGRPANAVPPPRSSNNGRPRDLPHRNYRWTFGQSGAPFIVGASLLLPFVPAHAGDLSSVDFSLRLPAALSKFSPYSDVAGVGGASAGSPYQTSLNPAATDWQPARPYTVALSPQYQAIVFGRGPTVHVAAESATLKLPEWGSVQLAAAQVRSVGSTSGAFTLLDGDYGEVQWSYRFADRLAAGLNINYTSLGTRAGAGGMTLTTSDAQTIDVRGGLLGAAASHLLLGLVVDYAASPATTMFTTPVCGCTLQVDDTTRQILVRAGTNYEYATKSSVYFDYQYGNFWNATGDFAVNRLYSGIEQPLYTWLYARTGLEYDIGGGVSPTAGIGVYPSNNVSIDIAFQDNMFRELRPEYGDSKTFGISVAVTF